MQSKAAPYFLVFLFACVLSCRNTTLDDVESYIQDRPDSALAVLRDMPQRAFKGRSAKARHALLTSMALDKNYVDVSSDSVIVDAVDWYERTGDTHRLMLSYYYAGKIQFNASNYPGAVIYGQKALDLARETGDTYYEGLSCWLLGDIFFTNHNYLKAQSFYSSSDNAFLLSGKDRHSLFSKLEQAKVLIVLKEYQKCDSLLNSVSSIIDNDDYAPLSICYSLQLRSCALQGKDAEAIALFEKWDRLPVKADRFTVYGEMATPFFRSGDKASAERCLDLAYRSAVGEQMNMAPSFSALLMYAKGDFKQALDSMSKAYDYQNTVAYEQFANSIDESIAEYYKSEAKHKDLLMRNRIVLLSVIAGILLLAALVYYLIKRKSYQDKLDAAKEDIAYITQMNSDSLKNFNKFLQIRQGMLDDVIAGYGSERSSKKAGAAYDVIDDKIENLKAGGDGFKKLVKDLNECFGDIVHKLKEHYPDISRQDYRILVYYFSGFSQETVSILTGVPVQKLYNFKRSWVDRFNQLPSPDRELFTGRMNPTKNK